jgi:hypothetical protein
MRGNAKPASGQIDVAKFSLLPFTPLIFSIALAIFVLGPPLLDYEFAPYPSMDVADILDLFTPLVILPLYWLLFYSNGNNPPRIKPSIVFMFFAGFWVLGQGMHLAANSIGHLIENMSGTDIYKLTYFYDETLGHYLWHFGVIGLSAVLIIQDRKKTFSPVNGVRWSNILGGIIYGFVFFAMINEGTTVPMGLPFSVLAIVFILISMRGRIKQSLSLFFLTGYSFASLLFAVWGIWHMGFPGFFDVGIIK